MIFTLIVVLWRNQVTKKAIMWGKTELSLYKLHSVIPNQKRQPTAAFFATLEHWHARLRHPNYKTFHDIVSQFHLPCSSVRTPLNKCEACCLGKMHKLSLSVTHNRGIAPLDLIHSDVWVLYLFHHLLLINFLFCLLMISSYLYGFIP